MLQLFRWKRSAPGERGRGNRSGLGPAAGVQPLPDRSRARTRPPSASSPSTRDLPRLQPKNPDLIGACCFYEAVPAADGYRVTVEIGWGDCPSGCINRHRWTYAVTGDGATTLESETGEPVPSGVPPGSGGSTGY